MIYAHVRTVKQAAWFCEAESLGRGSCMPLLDFRLEKNESEAWPLLGVVEEKVLSQI